MQVLFFAYSLYSSLTYILFARRMIYYNITTSDWVSLSRDAMNRKVLTSDKFKTSKSFGVDTVIFSPEAEKRIDLYLRYFRPVLLKDKQCDFLLITTNGTQHTRLSEDIETVFDQVRLSTTP